MIHLEVVVADTAELLDPLAYDAGALLRWESCATIDGAYAEGGTVALVADVSLYDVWDSAGTDGTWYRTRVSDAGGTTFSAYSSPFQSASLGLYLSIAQFKLLAPTTLSDEALLILLDSAQQEIVRYAGPAGSTNELLRASGDLVMLSRPALSITSVLEGHWSPVTLSANDYELRSSGTTLRRLWTGDNPSYHWRGRVDVTYLPVDDTASRQRVQAELTKLAIVYNPGLASQTIGSWAESYTTGTTTSLSYDQQRQAILSSLGSDGVVIF